MIAIDLVNNVEQELQNVMTSYSALPRHLAKKHLQASMRRSMKDGIPVLKRFTPKRKSRVVFGIDRASGEYTAKRVQGGALRRSVTTKAKFLGTRGAGAVYGVIGYRGGDQSAKALWLTEGTDRINPRAFFLQFQAAFAGPCLQKLKNEMVTGLENAVKELVAGKNPGRPV